MTHYDDDILALLALGEQGVTPDDDAHLTECAECRNQVDALAAVVATGRQTTALDLPTAPSPEVWTRIAAEVAADQHPEQSLPTPIDLSERRATKRRGTMLAVAAGIAGLLVGVGITFAATQTSKPASTTVATAAMQPVDSAAAHGTAYISKVNPATRTLTVSIKGLPAAKDGFYEVWLMNATPQRFVAVGILDVSHTGVFQIPAGLKLQDYPYIDVSLQPFNGSPLHSGTSLVRGALHA